MERTERISIEEYAICMAMAAAKRSEDPYIKVGAIALTDDNRIIATGYNGLSRGKIVHANFWEDRDRRLPFMIHAEQNLCSLFKRGEATWIATTLMPCSSCMNLLAAHGINRVLYGAVYERDQGAVDIASFHNILLMKFAG